MHIRDKKKQLRLAIEERLARMSDRERGRESRSLCRRILPEIPDGAVICAYWPLRTEADVRPLIEALIEREHRVFLPCFENALVFRECMNTDDLVKGDLGIMEPPPGSSPLEEDHPSIVVLVPARAYDRAGNRLGRGNGGYDIWMTAQRKRNPTTMFWGTALECQLLDEVPMERHDQHVDAVITARGWVEC